MIILLYLFMALVYVIVGIAAVAMVVGLFALMFMLVQAIAALFGLVIALPRIIDWVTDTYWKVFDRIVLPTANKLGYATAWVLVKLGLGYFALRAGERLLEKLDAADQEHDKQNHRDDNQDPNQIIHNPTSLR